MSTPYKLSMSNSKASWTLYENGALSWYYERVAAFCPTSNDLAIDPPNSQLNLAQLAI